MTDITLPRAELEQVLEALEQGDDADPISVGELMDALRERLAQPEQEAQTATYTCGVCGVSMQMEQTEQEPVAKDWRHVIPGRRHTDPWDSVRLADYNQGWNDCQKKTKTELEKLYTTPPKRKPLTDERIGQIIEGCKITLVNYCSDYKQIEFARAIEAAHGIKENT